MKKTTFCILILALTSSAYASKFKEGECYKLKDFDIKSYYAEIVGVTQTNYLIVSTKLGKYDRSIMAQPMSDVDPSVDKIACPK